MRSEEEEEKCELKLTASVSPIFAAVPGLAFAFSISLYLFHSFSNEGSEEVSLLGGGGPLLFVPALLKKFISTRLTPSSHNI